MFYILKNAVTLLLLLLLFPVCIRADDYEEIRFGWNIGNVKIYYDALNNIPYADLEVIHFRWIKNNISIGLNLFDFYGPANEDDTKSHFSVVPAELSYVPFNYEEKIYVSVYGKGGWLQTRYNNDYVKHSAFGAIGAQIFFFPETVLNYSPFFSVFFEYSTIDRLKIGVGLDLSFLVYLFILSSDDE